MIVNGIEFIGRFDLNNHEIKLAWSGSTIKADFYGTNISVKLSSSTFKDYFVVIVDNNVVNNQLHISYDGEYLLADNLELTNHTLELVKRTEFNIGTVIFKGFTFNNGHLLEREETKFNLKLQVIGDSLTCGYGNEGTEKNLYDSQYDNAYLAYGMIAARTLNADIRLLSCSGYGLMRNYSGDLINTMPTMIDKVTPLTENMWNESLYTPDLVVINLGTNDFSNGYIPDKDQFVNTYIKLINRIFSKYPQTKVLCTVGPVLSSNVLKLTKEYLNEVIHYFSHSVYYLEYETHKQSDGYGVSLHPSLITHQKMADSLVNKIKEIMY